MKKLLLQKLAQLRDKISTVSKDEIKDDYLKLKLSDDDKFYLTLKNKYKDEI